MYVSKSLYLSQFLYYNHTDSSERNHSTKSKEMSCQNNNPLDGLDQEVELINGQARRLKELLY